MTTAEERELLDEELAREVAASIIEVGIVAPTDDPIRAELLAGDLIDAYRKRRIVLYRRAVHTLPPGLHQTTIDEMAGGPILAEDPPAGSGATDREPETSGSTAPIGSLADSSSEEGHL